MANQSSHPPEIPSAFEGASAALETIAQLEREVEDLKRFQQCVLDLNHTLLKAIEAEKASAVKICLSLLDIVDNITELERVYEKGELTDEGWLTAPRYLGKALVTLDKSLPQLQIEMLPLRELIIRMQNLLTARNYS